MSFHEEVVTVVHLGAERVKGIDDLGNVSDDSFFSIREFGKIMPFYFGIDIELNHLGIDEDELEFGGMLLIEQRSDDSVQADGFTLSGGSCDEQMRHFAEVEQEYFIGDGLTESDGEVKPVFLKPARGKDRLHGNNLRIFVGDFDTYRTLAWHRSDDTDTESFEAQGDVIFEVTDFGYTDTGFGNDFVERDGGADGRLDGGDADTEIEESLFDVVFIGVLFLHIDLAFVVVVAFEEVEVRIAKTGEVEGRVVFAEFIGEGG
jgi:hypothetical protein